MDFNFNLVDDVFRGFSVDELIKSKWWLYVLEFFWGLVEYWFKRFVSIDEVEEDDFEVKKFVKIFVIDLWEEVDIIIYDIFSWILLWIRFKKVIVWLLCYKVKLKVVWERW